MEIILLKQWRNEEWEKLSGEESLNVVGGKDMRGEDWGWLGLRGGGEVVV